METLSYCQLMERCLAAEARVKQLNIDAGCYKRGMEASNKRLVQLAEQRDAVVAENVALKAFGDKLSDMRNDLNGEGTGIQGRAEVACQQIALEAAMEEFDTIKTPATDAILASLRAEGVEMFVAETSGGLRTAGGAWGVIQDPYSEFADHLEDRGERFARQLREGNVPVERLLLNKLREGKAGEGTA